MRALTALDELMQQSRSAGRRRRSPLMARFYRFHRRNPQLLDFLVQELKVLQENNWPTTSFEMLWHHARWVLTYVRRVPGETFVVDQNLMPHYSRAVIILLPDFNGFYRLKRAQADKDFGVLIAKGSTPGLRRLFWKDGTPIELGWRPSLPHVTPVEPVPRRRPVVRKGRAND